MKCGNCGAELAPASAFCSECGTRVGAANEAVTEFMGGSTQISTAAGGERLEPGSEFDGRYVIEERIGEGGMGVVYRALDKVTNQTIALKVINKQMLTGSSAVDRLISEGLLTRDIRHPNVVAVYDVAKADDSPYLTMEFLQGRSLRGWFGRQLSTGGEVTLDAAVGIMLAILDGLQAAHDKGIVHRDLSPENVILLGEPNDDDFRLKLLDFGIARAANVSLVRTAAGAMGKPLYMAPEQRTTPDAAGPAADIYSLARMLYEFLMDVLPDGVWQPPSKHRSDVPEAIDALLERGLSNRPRSRQQSVEEFREELLAAISGDAVITPDPQPREVIKKEIVSPPPQTETRQPEVQRATAVPKKETAGQRRARERKEWQERMREKHGGKPVKKGGSGKVIGIFAVIFVLVLYIVIAIISAEMQSGYY